MPLISVYVNETDEFVYRMLYNNLLKSFDQRNEDPLILFPELIDFEHFAGDQLNRSMSCLLKLIKSQGDKSLLPCHGAGNEDDDKPLELHKILKHDRN